MNETATSRAQLPPPVRNTAAELLRWIRFKPDHVVAALCGGVGNQLFQFAAGRALSLRLGVPLKLDFADTRDQWGRRGDELRAFRLGHARLTDHERSLWLGPGATPWTQRHFCRWVDRLLLRRRALERPFGDPAGPPPWRNPVFLAGMRQSAAYFADQADAIRAELLRHFPDNAIPEPLPGPHSVAVHVRRGDYLNPSVARLLGPCAVSYYERAAAWVRARVPEARFQLFTDDPEWVRAEPRLARLGPIRTPDAENPANDLMAMSRHRHFITANSTFSWWAAWLGQRADSIVISPTPWFDSAPADRPGIVPPNWIILPKT